MPEPATRSAHIPPHHATSSGDEKHQSPALDETTRSPAASAQLLRRELVTDYEKVDPLAVLPVHERLVENELVEAGAHHYSLAARRLAKSGKLAAGSEKAAAVKDLIADLRQTHRRRPRLQQEFDRAGLP